jgi:hypothetical protein
LHDRRGPSKINAGEGGFRGSTVKDILMALAQLLASRAAAFLLGAAAGGALSSSPRVRQGVRNLVRKGIRTGLVIKREVQALVDQVREDLQDLTAEAQAEVDREPPAAGTDGTGG